MHSERILSALTTYLSLAQVEELRLDHSLQNTDSDLILCMTVSDIVKKDKSTGVKRQKLLSLLSDLCSVHFCKQKS